MRPLTIVNEAIGPCGLVLFLIAGWLAIIGFGPDLLSIFGVLS